MITHAEASTMLLESLRWIDAACDQMPVPGDDRHRLGLAATDLLHEHARSVFHLLNVPPDRQPMVGSSLALLRPIYEALVRSWFILYAASDKEIASHIEGKDFDEKMVGLVKRVEQVHGLRHDGFLELVRKNYWRTLNGFTHGGTEQLSRRINATNLGHIYSESDAVLALLIANEFSLIAATVALEIGNRMKLAVECQDRLARISQRLNDDGETIRIANEVSRMTPASQ